jgi:hypothetical protein
MMTAAHPPPEIRGAVRDLLSASADFHSLDPETRKTIAGSMVRIAATAQALASEAEVPAPAPVARPVARAFNAGSEFSGVAANRVADTTRNILNAVSFPRFVTELINGVFKAMNDSNQQQMASYVELIQNVSNTLDGFADANVGVSGARQWLADRFPGTFVVEGDEDLQPEPGMSEEERRELQAERDASTQLRLAPNATMPTESALRSTFGIAPGEPVPSAGNPEALVPLARQIIARNRQQMLSTMVMMGLQRIVIESGKLNASMRFHIDTRSAANSDRGSSFDTRTTTDASAGAKFGPWGIDAKVQSTIGYVSTERNQSTEEMNTDLDLSSNVELIFKTDYVQLDRLAGGPAQERIRVNALNPEAEANLAQQDRANRRASQSAAETARSAEGNTRLARPGALPPSATTAPGSTPRPPTPTPPAPTPPVQPGAQQPGAQQPGAQQPGAQQPGAQQPGAQQRPAQQPAQQPGAQQPPAQQPGAQQPGAQQPPAQQPPAQQPPAQQPPAQQPGAQQPGAQQPGAQQPGAQQPGAQQPGAQPPGAARPPPPVNTVRRAA